MSSTSTTSATCWRRVRSCTHTFFSKKRRKFARDFVRCVLRQLADEFGAADAPIETFYLVGENDAAQLQSGRNHHFERIIFYLARDRAENGKPDFAVVRRRRENNGRPSSGLFMTGLRIEGDLDDIAMRRNVPTGHYQISRPTDGPKSTSAWRFFLLTRASSCLSDHFLF
jgi:hypothetical protein